MADGIQTEQLSVDSLSLPDYKAAREAGETETVSAEALKDARGPAVTGKENQREYNAKRDAQEKKGKSAYQKRIDRLVKERDSYKERLARYETENSDRGETETGNESTAAGRPERQSVRNESNENPEISELKERYRDWEAVMARAEREGMRIADEAAHVLQQSPHAGDLGYLVASNDELRAQLNSLPPAQQVREIRDLEARIAESKAGKEFLARFESELSPEDKQDLQAALARNPDAGDLPLMSDLNSLPNGIDVLRTLLTDPALCRRLAKMSRPSQTIELRRISRELEGEAALPEENSAISRRYSPIKPVSGGAAARSTVPLDKMDFASYKKFRDAGRSR